MYEAYLQSASAKIKLILEKSVFDSIVQDEFFYSYIPSVKIIDHCENFDATIFIENRLKNNIEINYPNITYQYNTLNTKDLISLIEYVFERARQDRGIVCIHGAGAIVNNKAVICWGPATGMGKTSLAVELSKLDNMFYSDEKILIDLKNKKVVGRINKQYVSNDYWKNKLGNTSYFEPKNLAPDKEYDISLFVYPLICDQKEYLIDRWNSNKFAWHLYEETSRKIRGTSRVLFDNTFPVMPLDSFALSITRLNLVKNFTKNMNAVYYKGNLNYISNAIKNMSF